MPSSWSNGNGSGNRIVIGIIAILSFITLILIIVLSTKRCDAQTCSSPPEYHYAATIQLANDPSSTFHPDILLFLTSKTGDTVTKAMIATKEVPIISKESAPFEFHSQISVDEIGQVDMLISSPDGLRPSGISLFLKPKLQDESESVKKTVKYCIGGDTGRDLQANVLYTLIVCPAAG